MIDLKPCPFCGGEASISDGYWSDGSWIGPKVRCNGCQVTMPPRRLAKDLDADEAWNKRVDLTS